MAEPRLVEHLQNYPGCCNVTGTSTGPFVESDYFLQFDGQVALSLEVMNELVKPLDLVPRADYERVSAEADAMQAQLDIALGRVEQLEAAHLALRKAVLATLREGVVTRHGTLQLRAVKGVKAIDLSPENVDELPELVQA